MHDSPLQINLMLVVLPKCLPRVEHLKRRFIWVGSGLISKHLIWLESLAMDKHTSLLRKLILI
jgi:hypothetical protein